MIRTLSALGASALATAVLAAPAAADRGAVEAYARNPANAYSTFQPRGDVFHVYDTSRRNRLWAWLHWEAYIGGATEPTFVGLDPTESESTWSINPPPDTIIRLRTCEGTSSRIFDGTDGTPDTCGRWVRVRAS